MQEKLLKFLQLHCINKKQVFEYFYKSNQHSNGLVSFFDELHEVKRRIARIFKYMDTLLIQEQYYLSLKFSPQLVLLLAG